MTQSLKHTVGFLTLAVVKKKFTYAVVKKKFTYKERGGIIMRL